METMNTIITTIILFLLTPIASGTTYPDNMDAVYQDGTNCELIAKYYAAKYHMELYIIVPLTDTGARMEGQYATHMINSKVIDGHRYFFEFNDFAGMDRSLSNNIFTSEEKVKNWYHGEYGKNSEIYSTSNAPFNIIWNYP
jgi:hypothetical protein